MNSSAQQTSQFEFMSPKQLEEELGIQMGYQAHLRLRKKLPFYRITGAGIRYKRSEIIKWIEKQKVV
ncbi:hypothetical protein BKN38_05285 [Helicobacter sp. CLO-3]|uniref:DNA-binding protein n=1 Tax=unclassified Helicobacter TaxID=2593540 RepID=UPI000805C475|nr:MULTISPECIES: DNA-binding protein [unclassified Helicobacter]OBV30136.1 hypothetical protein BA723_02520 [Helicobacter sp. CLO-3]OHU83520.1 hypothetical protein BKN38_05285 [Helicobacter sp. CLO-3]